MPGANEATDVGLSLLRRAGGLSASLTDFRLVAEHGHVESIEDALAALRRVADALEPLLARRGTDTADSADAVDSADAGDDGARLAAGRAVCDLGALIYESLLPPSIKGFLRSSPARTTSLQLEPDLAAVPWELAFDGEAFLGEKLRVGRQVVLADPPRARCRPLPKAGALKVLVLAGAGAAGSAQGLVARLRIVEGLAVSTAKAGDLRNTDLLALIGASDVVHYLGAVDGGTAPGGSVCWWRDAETLDLRELAALPSPPALLISQNAAAPAALLQPAANRSLAQGASALGLNVLALEGPHDHGEAMDLVLAVYHALVAGASLGEAVRAGRAAVHRQAGIARLAALQAELYGDAAMLPFGRDRRAKGDDNRRQVTAMSFDLVDSTGLMHTLGEERYGDALAQYHRRCAGILRAHGGAPDDPQGDDGIMCYFGFPLAHEDAASRALRAGLEMIHAVQELGLSVRIGVCSGQVVVRDDLLYGPAIHLAARLQSIAAPGTMVAAETTQRLVKSGFRFRPMELQSQLKGFDKTQRCFHVLAAGGPSGPPEPEGLETAGLTPFVGRHAELQLLEEHWASTAGGKVELVRIVGEAGIGKSRLLREFKRSLVGRGHTVFECRCAPDDVHSAFHPLIESTRRELGIVGGESAGELVSRLTRLVSGIANAGEDATALLADLLSIPLATRHPVFAHSPERRRQLTMNLLIALAARQADERAACLIVEDVHWADPSTAEFLNRLVVERRHLPLLILVTSRPDVDVPWHPRVAVHEMELRGLSAESSRRLVVGTCGQVRLPSEVVHLIAARADGVPLFIEESTRMALEEAAGTVRPQPAALSVPTTILDLLTARLDRLGGAKQVAQVGGTIGREFSLALLQAVLADPGSPFMVQDVPAQLAALTRSGVLIGRVEGDDTRYAFKHALLRDAAGRSLLERDRVRLHRVVAGVLAEQFPDLAERQPELLAFHYAEAGIESEALRCWEAAARQAASRSAHPEAISHVNSALAVLSQRPPDTDRDRIELRLQLLLATRLIATEGYGAERVERVYGRAMELARSLGDDAASMKVLLGLEGYHFMRADFAKAKVCALEVSARVQGSPIHHVQSKWATANMLMHQGEMETAVALMDACLAEYDRLEHWPGAVQDPGVMCLCYSAWSMWELGFPDEALRRVVTVVQRAERLQHRFSMGEAYGFRAAVQHFRGENEAALASAERAIEICEENGFAVWLAHARVMRGRVLADLGDAAAGIEEMRSGYDLWADTGAVVTTPFYLALRAEGLSIAGRPAEGLALVERALAIVERNGERYYEAEIRRLIGQLTLEQAAPAANERRAEAEAMLQSALACAQGRRQRSLALRCAISLADLWRSQGRHQQAKDVLWPAYRSIEEGAGTRDLLRAWERLQALQ